MLDLRAGYTCYFKCAVLEPCTSGQAVLEGQPILEGRLYLLLEGSQCLKAGSTSGSRLYFRFQAVLEGRHCLSPHCTVGQAVLQGKLSLSPHCTLGQALLAT